MIPGSGTGSGQCLASRDQPLNLHRHLKRSAHCVTTNQRYTVRFSEAIKPRSKAIQKIGIGFGKCQGKRNPGRSSAHRGHITQIDRKGLVTNRLRVGPEGKMPPGNQRIDTHRQLHLGWDIQQGRIIPDTQYHILSAVPPAEILRDDAEFRQRHGEGIS